MFHRRAFTFVELMVVLTIIAVLMSIAIPNFLEFQTRGVVTRTKSELTMIKMALEQYRLDYRAYPPNREPGKPSPDDLSVLTTPLAYLSLMPLDPFTTEVGRSPNHPRPIDRSPYMYYNALQLHPEQGLTINDADSMHQGFAAGLLWGLGPGAALPVEERDPFTVLLPDGSVNMLAYDPTNGTTSKGDIHQLIN